MVIYVLCEKYAAFSPDCGAELGIDEAEKLLRKLLDDRNITPWKRIHIDVYGIPGQSLYIAYPEAEMKIRLAEYALPFIEEYFTE